MDKSYPTTVAELTEMMEAGWPEVRQSARAVEWFVHLRAGKDDNPQGKAVVFLEEDNAGVVPLVHTTYVNGIQKQEGRPLVGVQKFFTEEDAVRATWFEYMTTTPPSNFVTGYKPLCLVWRDKPEILSEHGVCKVRSRYSCVWANEEGAVVTTSHSLNPTRA